MRESFVVTSAYTHPHRLWGRERGATRQPDEEWRMASFLGGKSHGAFGQQTFFLVGNHMTTIIFEKEFSFKRLIIILFSKKIVRQC